MERAKILVVEDEPEIAEALQVNLEGAGYQVLLASDGVQALRLFDQQRPDLATVDLMLPEVSGFRLVELMKRPAAPGPVPVIVISALSFEEGEDAVRAGADAFITKPLDPDDLVRKVRFVLEKRACEWQSLTGGGSRFGATLRQEMD